MITALFCLAGIVPKDSFAQKLDQKLLKSVTFRAIGPTQQSGRFVDFAIPKQQPYTFYAATASGGLWKTTNNGITFQPIFDHESVFSIGDIAVAASDPNIVWVGSGEANNSRSSYWGDGVYKSKDAGKTWKNMGLIESHHIGRILVHPQNPNIVYVAALGHLYSDNPERGLYKTTDSGRTWNKVLNVEVRDKNIGVVDVTMDPTNSDILYAATYDKARKPYTFNLGGPGSGLYKTTDGGKTWAKLGEGLPGGMLGRIGIDIYRKNPNILYATIENANKLKMSAEKREKELLEDKSSRGMIGGEVYRSDDAGKSWRKVSPDGENIGGTNLQLSLEGFYTLLADTFILNEKEFDSRENALVFERINGSNSKVYGLSFEFGYQLGRYLSFLTGWTVQRSRLDEPEPDFGSTDLFRSPNNYGFLVLNYENEKLADIDLSLEYTGSMIVPHYSGFIAEDRLETSDPFWVLNGKITKPISLGNDNSIDLFVGVANLFNSFQKDLDKGLFRDSAYVYGPSKPRAVYAGFEFTF